MPRKSLAADCSTVKGALSPPMRFCTKLGGIGVTVMLRSATRSAKRAAYYRGLLCSVRIASHKEMVVLLTRQHKPYLSMLIGPTAQKPSTATTTALPVLMALLVPSVPASSSNRPNLARSYLIRRQRAGKCRYRGVADRAGRRPLLIAAGPSCAPDSAADRSGITYHRAGLAHPE